MDPFRWVYVMRSLISYIPFRRFVWFLFCKLSAFHVCVFAAIIMLPLNQLLLDSIRLHFIRLAKNIIKMLTMRLFNYIMHRSGFMCGKRRAIIVAVMRPQSTTSFFSPLALLLCDRCAIYFPFTTKQRSYIFFVLSCLHKWAPFICIYD